MANGLYDAGKEAFLTGAVSWSSDNIKVALIDAADYTVNLATDEDLADIAGGAIVATSGNLASKTSTAGVADAADVTFTAVTGDQSEALVVYYDSGVAGTSTLLAYIDTGTGLPVTPNGGDITVTWNGSGIFEI
jgi:hypothetical protein